MVSDKGIELIKRFEGCRLKAYPDPATGAEPWTIGWGHTKGVKQGDTCTQEQADAWLREEATEYSIQVLKLVKGRVTQNQLDALTSFAYNVGIGALAKSTLLRLLNEGKTQEAAEQFSRWNKAAGKVMAGLSKRREAERRLFLEPEQEMLPFIAAALPALIQTAPALIRIFGNSPQAEKNAQAAELVANIAKEATGETTVEGAVNAIQTDPEKAAAYREAVHQSMGELMGYMIQAHELDEKSRASAVDRAVALGKATGGKWLWLLGLVALVVVGMTYWITRDVLFGMHEFGPDTKALLLGQVVILGFTTVLAFLFGSNIQSRLRDQTEQKPKP